jgi:hypothetical protein
VATRPIAVHASSERRRYPATATTDLRKTTSWHDAAPGNGEGQRLVYRFDTAKDLGRIGFWSGASVRRADYLGHPRPHVVKVTANGQSAVVSLDDTPGAFQTRAIDLPAARSVTLEIVSVYQTENDRNHACALAEVEFWAKERRPVRVPIGQS